MKNTLRSLIIALVCAALTVCGLPALAAETEEAEAIVSGDYAYVLLEDGGICITDYTGDAEHLDVPAELDGRAVREIGDGAFSGCDALTSITLPDSLTSIGDDAFCICDVLTSITLPDSLTSIGDSAFYSCTALTSVSLPDSLTSIGTNPFASCDALTAISVSPDHPTLAVIDGVLYEKDSRALLSYPAGKMDEHFSVPEGILSIGDYAFFSCTALTSITLPDSLTSIDDDAFYGCDVLTSVSIPNSLTSISDSAFFSCDALTSVSLPDSLTSIGDDAFACCSTLTSVTLPDSLTSIGDGAFAYCDALTLTVGRDSYASQYAIDNNIPYTYPDANDWLNG